MSAAPEVRRVHFRHPFQLPGMSDPHPAGSFDVIIETIPLDVSWDAHRVSATLMLTRGGTTSAQPVRLQDIEAELSADQADDVKTGHS